jgi:acetylornithine deacetylase/succinyl-diaminopimelate desuccinylase-like protein
VRCKESLSHHPDESVTEEDVGIAIEVMKRFLELVGEAHKT